VPEEIQIDRLDNQFSTMLDIRGRPKIPTSILTAAVGVIPIFGTSPYGNVRFDSVVGAAGIKDVELDKTPEGKVRIPIAIEGSFQEATTHNVRIFLKWDRAGVTTSVCIEESSIALGNNQPLPVRNLDRLYLGPTARIQLQLLSLGGAATVTLKMAFLELPLGETCPP